MTFSLLQTMTMASPEYDLETHLMSQEEMELQTEREEKEHERLEEEATKEFHEAWKNGNVLLYHDEIFELDFDRGLERNQYLNIIYDTAKKISHIDGKDYSSIGHSLDRMDKDDTDSAIIDIKKCFAFSDSVAETMQSILGCFTDGTFGITNGDLKEIAPLKNSKVESLIIGDYISRKVEEND